MLNTKIIKSIRFVLSVGVDGRIGSTILYCELDSHADTTCAGANFLRIDFGESHTTNVYGFNGAKAANVPITTAATLYQNKDTGAVYILVLQEVLFFGDRLKSSLLNPNQLRFGSSKVNDIPRQFCPESTHEILVESPGEPKLRIPLQMKGVMSVFESRKPTMEEYEDPSIPKYVMTVDSWDPNSKEFEAKEEQATVASVARGPMDTTTGDWEYDDMKVASALNTFQESCSASVVMQDECLYERMISCVNVAADDTVGDGLEGHLDEEVYHLDDASRQVFAVTTAEKKSILQF